MIHLVVGFTGLAPKKQSKIQFSIKLFINYKLHEMKQKRHDALIKGDYSFYFLTRVQKIIEVMKKLFTRDSIDDEIIMKSL